MKASMEVLVRLFTEDCDLRCSVIMINNNYSKLWIFII